MESILIMYKEKSVFTGGFDSTQNTDFFALIFCLILIHKIKVSIRFKGRELAHPELGEAVLNRFAEAVSNIAEVEQKPKLEGRFMTMMLMPKKEK